MSLTPRTPWSRIALGAALAAAAFAAAAQGMPVHHAMMAGASAPAAQDTRTPVDFPPQLRSEVLATMRMHLQGVSEVQQAMTDGRFDEAARIASMTLGMSAMHGDQAQQEARFMPPGMRQLGSTLHMQAGEFVLAAQDAAATGDTHKPQMVFGHMLQTCVACHAAYRLR
ncbi:MAG: hypothetical protein KGJ64_03185 [Betaproteobacteria bacterium]|nr:hypothetical protein [Betaproteobacteria bacterium]